MSGLTASCGCGAVRMEITEPPVSAGYCHCTRCQKRTGTAASPSAVCAPGSVKVVEGEDALAVWAPEGGFEKVFCSRCGSHLMARDPDDHGNAAVRMSAFDSDPGVRFEWRQFVRSAPAWEGIPDDGLRRYEGRRG